jgi:uncharacterized repeat protein (TIGR03803 family)
LDEDIPMKKSWLTLTFALAVITFSLAVSVQAQTVTVIGDFNWPAAAAPTAPIQATDGNFYGSAGGGAFGQGVIYRMSPGGKISPLYNFCSQPGCPDGTDGTSSPILGSDGSLYGINEHGGSNDSGVIYKLTLEGELTVLSNLCPAISCSGGTRSYGLLEGSDGNFYGTTFQGGAFNGGTIFRISPTGDLQVLYSFCALTDCADGWLPQAPPIQGIDGNYYGVVTGGGSMQGGLLYRLTPSGTYSIVRNFCTYATGSCTGAQPESIVQDAGGNFFGVAEFAGVHGYGSIFEITATHQYKILHSLDAVTGYPLPGLALASDGNVYGKTEGSPSGLNFGTLFEVTAQGDYTRFYTFEDCQLGELPWWGPLFQGTDGRLYGGTIGGGSQCGELNTAGTIFAVDNGLSRLVRTAPTAGKVGKTVLILGQDLTGTSSVTFNGVPATFAVESDTYIKATVPAGATTGVISVVTPGATLKSNPQFVVTK